MTKIIVMLFLVFGVSCTTTGCEQNISSDTGAGGGIDIGVGNDDIANDNTPAALP